jgi:hypothetical protein
VADGAAQQLFQLLPVHPPRLPDVEVDESHGPGGLAASGRLLLLILYRRIFGGGHELRIVGRRFIVTAASRWRGGSRVRTVLYRATRPIHWSIEKSFACNRQSDIISHAKDQKRIATIRKARFC